MGALLFFITPALAAALLAASLRGFACGVYALYVLQFILIPDKVGFRLLGHGVIRDLAGNILECAEYRLDVRQLRSGLL